MALTRLAPDFSVSPQLTLADIADAARQGFRTIVSNRPDGEDAAQPTAAEIGIAARDNGLSFVHIPVAPGAAGLADAERLRTALAEAAKPVLAFCRSGSRSTALWTMLQDQEQKRTSDTKRFDVVIVGGGAAGIAAAASLLKRAAGLKIAVIEPSGHHDYQPGWTMVGAGNFSPEQTRRTQAAVMPAQVEWLRTSVLRFAPESDEVGTADGRTITYRALVVAPGLTLAWDAIPGLAAALGSNGVTSNYRYDLAPYTRDLVQGLERGRALFSQPPMPIKCAGAPQKAMCLSADLWRKKHVLRDIEIEFHNAGTALFGVAAYVPALMAYIERYGIDLRLGSALVAVDGPARVATFARTDEEGAVHRIERAFDMLHAVPPQVAPAFVARSPLAAASGFVEVDPATLRHVRYANVFSLGDAADTTNAKTAAAARKQAPIVAVNVLATLAGKALPAAYDGYGACPLTVEHGRIVFAEFGYGGKLLPNFPRWLLDGTRPSRAAWFLNERMLPPLYWQGMLKGREWMARPRAAGGAA